MCGQLTGGNGRRLPKPSAGPVGHQASLMLPLLSLAAEEACAVRWADDNPKMTRRPATRDLRRPIVDGNNWDQEMARGTVKWFNSQKGYGFIQPQSGGKDVFVHISAVEKAGLTTLNEGQIIEYEEVSNRGKTSAENLKVQR